MNNTRNYILLTVAVNVALPVLVYRLMLPHTNSLTALIAAALVPLLDTAIHLIRYRKADAFSGFIFLGLVLSVAAALLGGDERFILLRESYVTGLMGVVFLGSLLASRPLIYYFAQRFTGRDPKTDDKWSTNSDYRRNLRRMTGVWGCILVLEAGLKAALIYMLSIPAFLAVSSILTYGVIGLMILWNVRYVRRIKHRIA